MKLKRFDQGDPRLADAKWAEACFKGERFASHLNDHLHEFEGFTDAQYLDQARALLAAKPGGGVEGFVSNAGWVFYYDRNTNDFAIGRPEGIISTLYKPGRGLTYWKEEKHKRGFK